MYLIEINSETCINCGRCAASCPFFLFKMGEGDTPRIREKAGELCIFCGHCIAACPTNAVSVNGVDGTRCEPAREATEDDFDRFKSLVKSRRSIRRFREKPVESAKMGKLLDLVRWAPSAANTQPVKWAVVNDSDMIRRLSVLAVDWMRENPRFESVVTAYDKGHDPILRGAPSVVVAYATDDAWNPAGDCVIAMTTFELAAAALGLGTCWAGFLMAGAKNDPKVGEMLDLPEGHSIHAAMMVGYAAESYHLIPPRKELECRWIH